MEFRTDLNITEEQFMNLYGWYSWPSIFLGFIGGYLLDNIFGLRFGTALACLFVVLGQVFLSIGAFFGMIELCYFGRFIFGCGGETLSVAQKGFIAQWFDQKSLNFVLGLQLSFARIAATTNMNIMSPIYEMCSTFMNPGAHTLGMALLFATFFPIGSFISSALLGWLDNRLQNEAAADGFQRTDLEDRGQIRSRRSTESSIEEMGNRTTFPKINSNPEFWLLAGICFLYFGAVTPFIGIAEMWFQVIYGFNQSEASFLNSVIFIMSMVLSPVFGLIIDRVGFNLYFILGAHFICLTGHLLLGFVECTPWIGVVLIALSFSILPPALWALTPILSEPKNVNMSYGILTSLQNLGLAVLALGAGSIATFGWMKIELLFSLATLVSLMLTLVLFAVDAKNGSRCNINKRKSAPKQRIFVDNST